MRRPLTLLICAGEVDEDIADARAKSGRRGNPFSRPDKPDNPDQYPAPDANPKDTGYDSAYARLAEIILRSTAPGYLGDDFDDLTDDQITELDNDPLLHPARPPRSHLPEDDDPVFPSSQPDNDGDDTAHADGQDGDDEDPYERGDGGSGGDGASDRSTPDDQWQDASDQSDDDGGNLDENGEDGQEWGGSVDSVDGENGPAASRRGRLPSSAAADPDAHDPLRDGPHGDVDRQFILDELDANMGDDYDATRYDADLSRLSMPAPSSSSARVSSPTCASIDFVMA